VYLPLTAASKDSFNMPDLFKAVEDGDTHMLLRALASGKNIESRYQDGKTALMIASVKGHEEISKILLDKGAKIDAKNDGGWTPLM
jgi:uncharacterized protein